MSAPAKTTFTDTKGRTWDLQLSVRAASEVRKRTGADLLNQPLKAIELFGTDQFKFFEAAWCIVRPQADTWALTEEQFQEAIAGDAIEQALDAFFEALISFSQSPSGRATLRQVQETLVRIGTKVRQKAEERLSRTLEGLDLEKEMERFVTSGGFATSSPASSASTPPASPSGS